MSESHNFHYHIRWSGDTRVDWDRFTTAEEAKCCADQMVRSGEDYAVEKFDDDCVRCEELRRSKHHTDAGSLSQFGTTLITSRYAHTFLFVCPECNLPIAISRIRPGRNLETIESEMFDIRRILRRIIDRPGYRGQGALDYRMNLTCASLSTSSYILSNAEVGNVDTNYVGG